MQQFRYPAKIAADRKDGGFVVTFRDLRGAITQGDTREEAVTQAADCLHLFLASCMKEEFDIPRPSLGRRGETPIAVSGLLAAKLALYIAMREAGLTKAALAKRLKVDEKEVRRMLDPSSSSKLPRLEAALRTLGKRLIIGFEAA